MTVSVVVCLAIGLFGMGCRTMTGPVSGSALPFANSAPADVEHSATNSHTPASGRRAAVPSRDRVSAEVFKIPAIIAAHNEVPVLSHNVAPTIYRLTSSPFDTRTAHLSTGRSGAFFNSGPRSIRLAAFNDDVPEFADEEGIGSPFAVEAETVDNSPVFAPTFCMQVRSDAREFLPGVWDDTRAIVNWHNGAWILGATGIALALRADADDEVREWTAEHPDRWGDGSKVLGILGEVQWQVPVLFAVYGQSVWTEDVKLYDFSRSLISAYTIAGVSTVAIKGIANTERPSDEWNDGELGFPSFHTSSSFTIAAVIEEYYGIERAAPMYVLAGLIGWSRIDERDHDLSDVMFGAMLGYIIGKSVAAYHLTDDPRVRIRPTYSRVDETYGVMLETTY